MYINTPTITVIVPIPLNRVTGFPNISTESHISNARLAVFATLKENLFISIIIDSKYLEMC